MKSPTDRPASAAEVIQTLNQLIAEASRSSEQTGRFRPDLPDVPPPIRLGDTVQDQIRSWKATGQAVLDVTSMALLHRYPKDTTFEEDDLLFVFRSALHLEMDLDPWMDRAATPRDAISALDKILHEYPKPEIRQKIVSTLTHLQDEQATDVLLWLVQEDDYHEVRSLAAVEVSRRGKRESVVSSLLDDIRNNNDPVALAALIAVADEVGLPEDAGEYPQLQVLYGLFQRRWKTSRDEVLKFALRGGWRTGLFTLLLGLLTPLYTALLNPQNYTDVLFMWTVPVWSLVGGVTTMVVGGFQGYISSLALGIADLTWQRTNNQWGRYLLGAASGLFFSFYEIIFIMLNLLAKPQLGVGLYVPLLVLFGLVIGLGLAVVIPPFYSKIQARQHFLKALGTAMLITGIAAPFYWLINLEFDPDVIVFRLFFVFMLIIGAGLSTIRKKEAQAG